MRRTQRFVFCVAIFGCALVESAKSRPLRPRAGNLQTVSAAAKAEFSASAAQLRTPETEPGQPGQWPQSGGRRIVDVIQLKNEAKELTNLSNALPAQMEQIGNGRLPKELIDNLKKIEKLAKRIRGEIS
jgi:hypothetical protein